MGRLSSWHGRSSGPPSVLVRGEESGSGVVLAWDGGVGHRSSRYEKSKVGHWSSWHGRRSGSPVLLAWEEEWVTGRLGMRRDEWVNGRRGMGGVVVHRLSWYEKRRVGQGSPWHGMGEWVTSRLGMRTGEWVTGRLGMGGGVGHRSSWYEKR